LDDSINVARFHWLVIKTTKNIVAMSTQKLEELVARLEAVTAKLEKKAGGSSSAPTTVADEEASEAVVAYEAWESEFLAPFLSDAKALNDAKEGVTF
jgi:hypothetical protein